MGLERPARKSTSPCVVSAWWFYTAPLLAGSGFYWDVPGESNYLSQFTSTQTVVISSETGLSLAEVVNKLSDWEVNKMGDCLPVVMRLWRRTVAGSRGTGRAGSPSSAQLWCGESQPAPVETPKASSVGVHTPPPPPPVCVTILTSPWPLALCGEACCSKRRAHPGPAQSWTRSASPSPARWWRRWRAARRRSGVARRRRPGRTPPGASRSRAEGAGRAPLLWQQGHGEHLIKWSPERHSGQGWLIDYTSTVFNRCNI